MAIDLFDRNGNPVAYAEDDEHIHTFDGRAVGYVADGSVYSYSGAHLGWLEHGLVRDHNGNVVFFSPGSSGGPLKPLMQLRPLKSLRELRPLKDLREPAPLRPLSTNSWSIHSGAHFFR